MMVIMMSSKLLNDPLGDVAFLVIKACANEIDLFVLKEIFLKLSIIFDLPECYLCFLIDCELHNIERALSVLVLHLFFIE